jgi:hypothetical protein
VPWIVVKYKEDDIQYRLSGISPRFITSVSDLSSYGVGDAGGGVFIVPWNRDAVDTDYSELNEPERDKREILTIVYPANLSNHENQILYPHGFLFTLAAGL